MTTAKQEIQRRSARANWFGFIAEQVAAYRDRRRTAHALNGHSAHLLKDVGMTVNDVSDFEKSSAEQGKAVLMQRAKERSGNW